MALQPRRFRGVLGTWNDQRGFGFIKPENGGATIFVHISAYPKNSPRPEVGDRVEFQFGVSDDGRRSASLVRTAGRTDRGPNAERRSRTGAAASKAFRRPAGAESYLGIVALVAIYIFADIRWGVSPWIGIGYVLLSALCFEAYAGDKRAAGSGSWRESETGLLVLGLIGGWPGAIAAQQLLRHKTRKPRFLVPFAVTVLVNIAVFVGLAANGVFDRMAAFAVGLV